MYIFPKKNKDVHCFSYFFAIVKEELRKKDRKEERINETNRKWKKKAKEEKKTTIMKDNKIFKELSKKRKKSENKQSNKQMKY